MGTLPTHIASRNLRVAISGGGFRATLFALGSIVYLVDVRLNERVTEIRSVSGGSILNGILAAAGDVSAMGVRDIDNVAVTLLRTIAGRGLVMSSWLTPAYLGLLGGGAVALVSAGVTGWPVELRWWQIVTGILVLGAFLMFRGALLQHLMWRQFFHRLGGAAKLGEVKSTVRHVFCATDLNSAEPATFVVGNNEALLVTTMGTVDAAQFRLERSVRASAAFPGLVPPARMPLRPHGLAWRYRVQRVPPGLLRIAGAKNPRTGRTLHIADGGVTNNLATEEGKSGSAEGRLLLVVDASAPLTTARLLGLAVPYIAEVGSIGRSMSVLYTNTVEPRIAELEARGALILSRDENSPSNEDFPIVVRASDNTSDSISRIRRMRLRAGLPTGEADEAKRIELARRSWNKAADYLHRKYQHKVMAVRSSRVPTTFGRIKRSEALGLILHGYLSTMTALSYTVGAPVDRLDIRRFERLMDLQCGETPGVRDNYDYL
jgi:predicted acylesterase/phospholipase RssA